MNAWQQKTRVVWARTGAGLMALGMSLALFSCGNNSKEEAMRSAGKADMDETRKILHSRLGGSWYSGDPKELRNELDGYMAAVTAKPLPAVCALITPHAGYAYSGAVAAHAYKAAQGRTYKRIVVLGPSHRVSMPNLAGLPDATHLATVLGEVPLDQEFMAALLKHACFRVIPQAHAGEHSVEIQVPLLQTAFRGFQLVPIVVGQLDAAGARQVGAALRGLVDDQTLVVVSTDFTHFGARFDYLPFRNDVAANLEKLDLGAFEFVKSKDLAGFEAYVDRTGATICGRCPVAVLLAMLPDHAQVHLLRYATSGGLTGDYENSVSYVAAAVTGQWTGRVDAAAAPVTEPAAAADPQLTATDQEQLLKLARGTLEYYMAHRKRPQPQDLGIALTPGMQRTMGAFVTLKAQGQLRGCIGEIFPRRPLYEAVMDHALNSALNDTRFMPVPAGEVKDLEFEISALHPPHPVAAYQEIEIGRHGVVLSKRGRSAVFLPQVAPEQGWGVEETLTHLAMKAGLPPDAWKEGCEFEVFEATVFHE